MRYSFRKILAAASLLAIGSSTLPASAQYIPGYANYQVSPGYGYSPYNAQAYQYGNVYRRPSRAGRVAKTTLIGAGIGAGTGAVVGLVRGGRRGIIKPTLIGAGVGAGVGLGYGLLTRPKQRWAYTY